MLSRIARGMYELGRCIEQAENITRILDVNQRMSLEHDYFSELDVWSPILDITGSRELFDSLYDEVSEEHVYDFLLLSGDNPGSVLSSLRLAREYARTMRERISEEMWEHLNRMHLEMQGLTLAQVMRRGSSDFNRRIQLLCNAFHGFTDNTMVHGEAWQFLQLGRYLERTLKTGRILGIKYRLLLPDADEVGRPLDIHQWQALLRSVSAYEAYRRLYHARIAPEKVVHLMLFDSRFPRSIRFCIAQVNQRLRDIGAHTEEQRALLSTVETLHVRLQHESGEQVLVEGLQQQVVQIEEACFDLHGDCKFNCVNA